MIQEKYLAQRPDKSYAQEKLTLVSPRLPDRSTSGLKPPGYLEILSLTKLSLCQAILG
jgi:hypothetical protein